MARRKTIIEDDGPEDVIRPSARPINGRHVEFPGEDDDVTRILRDGGDEELRLKLVRVTANGESFVAWLTPVGDSGVDESQIQEKWGGGHYVVKVYKGGIARGSRPLLIEALPSAARENPSGGVSSDIRALLDASARREQMLMDLVINRKTEVTPVSEILQGVAAIQNMTGQREGSVELFLKGLEMGRTLNGNDDKDGGWQSVVKDLMPILPALLGGKPVAAPTAPAKEAPAQLEAHALTNEKEQLAPLIGYLKTQALAGADPGAFAHIAVMNRSNPMYQPLLAFVLQSSFEQIQALDVELAREPHLTWFRALVDGLRSGIEEADRMEADPVGETGDTGNVVPHAGSRKTRRG